MGIQTHPTNEAAGPLCGSQDFNFQHYNQRLVCINPNMSIVDPPLRFNSNAYNINHSSTTPNSHSSLALIFQDQRNQVDQFIKLQKERLRIMLQEQRKQQAVALLKRVEMDAVYMMSQKDRQIEQAVKEKAELEAFVARMEAENELWRREAREKEAMVISLNQSLEQMKERATFFNNGGVAESCYEQNNRRVWSGECEEQSTRKMKMVCKNCDSRRSVIMFLPCRHLCSCKACEPFLQACPICSMPKKNTIEITDF